MKTTVFLFGLMLILTYQKPVKAQDKAPVADDPYGQSGTHPKPEAQPKQPTMTPDSPMGAEEGEEDDSPFGWFTFSPQVGFAYFPEAEMEVKGVTLRVDSRKAFVGKVHLDLGGDGLAFELVPLIAVEQTGGWDDMKVDASSGLGGGLGGSFVALGGQVSLMYRFRAGNFFPHLGLGFHGAYLTSDSIDYGAEFYGRIPIGFSVYMGENIAFVMELGIMFGATGVRGKPTGDLDYLYEQYPELEGTKIEDLTEDDIPAGMTDADVKKVVEAKIAEELKFGTGFAFDLMIGLRFP